MCFDMLADCLHNLLKFQVGTAPLARSLYVQKLFLGSCVERREAARALLNLVEENEEDLCLHVKSGSAPKVAAMRRFNAFIFRMLARFLVYTLNMESYVWT